MAKQELRVIEFEGYGLKINDDVMGQRDALPARTLSSLALLRSRSPVNDGELSWRVGLLLAGINLVFIALAVSNVNPRVGRSGNLIFALFAFVIYYNLINMVQAWITADKVTPLHAMLLLHGMTFAGVALWIGLRHSGWSLRDWLPPRPVPDPERAP